MYLYKNIQNLHYKIYYYNFQLLSLVSTHEQAKHLLKKKVVEGEKLTQHKADNEKTPAKKKSIVSLYIRDYQHQNVCCFFEDSIKLKIIFYN